MGAIFALLQSTACNGCCRLRWVLSLPYYRAPPVMGAAAWGGWVLRRGVGAMLSPGDHDTPPVPSHLLPLFLLPPPSGAIVD